MRARHHTCLFSAGKYKPCSDGTLLALVLVMTTTDLDTLITTMSLAKVLAIVAFHAERQPLSSDEQESALPAIEILATIPHKVVKN